MRSIIFSSFLATQMREGLALAGNSDILTLLPIGNGPEPPQRFVAEYRCKGIVLQPDGSIGEANLFQVGIFFPDDYLSRAFMPEVLTWLSPANAHHPNCRAKAGAICIGRLEPGTDLVSLLYQIFEIIVFWKFNSDERNALDKSACAWARKNLHRFPLDRRPLRRPAYLPEQERLVQKGAA